MTTTLSESHDTRAPLYTTHRLAAERLVLLYKFNVFIPVAIMLAGTPLYKFCVIGMCGVCMVLLYLSVWGCGGVPWGVWRPEEEVGCLTLSTLSLIPLSQGLSVKLELGWHAVCPSDLSPPLLFIE